MQGTVGPDVAAAALALRRTHPAVPARDILDLCLRDRTGRLAAFGGDIAAGNPFAILIAEAFDTGMQAQDWAMLRHPNCDPRLSAALIQIWRDEVLPRFAACYGLRP